MNRHKFLAKLIEWSVPALNIFRRPVKWPYSLEELERMDEGTLGRELFEFLHSRDLGYLPKYEEHDAYHALLGYGTTVTEELKLQAFMWGNGNSTFAGRVLFLIGYSIFPSKHRALLIEMKRGQLSKSLSPIPVASLMCRNLHEIRKELLISTEN